MDLMGSMLVTSYQRNINRKSGRISNQMFYLKRGGKIEKFGLNT